MICPDKHLTNSME